MEDDDLIFSFDEEEAEEEGAGGVEAEEAQNRTFLIVAGVLGALFILGLIFIGFLLLTQKPSGPSVSEIELTNQAMMTLAAATQTADFLTLSAPTETPPPPTATATWTVVPPTPTEAAEEEIATPTEGAGTPGGEVPAETPTGEAPLELTPLGGETPQPTGIGGPLTPTPEVTLPATGFSGSIRLAGAGLVALALIAVMVIVRRLRLK